jgi:hypothetical protein
LGLHVAQANDSVVTAEADMVLTAHLDGVVHVSENIIDGRGPSLGEVHDEVDADVTAFVGDGA